MLLAAVGVAVLAPVVAAESPSASAPPAHRTLRVPADFADLDAAIDASRPGDVILLAPGVYPGGAEVPKDRPGITIRGEDRNAVVFDGENTRANAIDVTADGVSLENMSAHDFTANGFYWEDVEGYAGRYLTVWNVGLYGIYAIESRNGVLEDSFVSGAGDAAFYIGECYPCDATVRRVTGMLSAVGYSGTNAGGNLVVEDSRWLLNWVGILPNSFDVSMQPPPQREAVFRNNEVDGTGTVVTPRNTPLGGYHGVGIAVAGGVRNVIEDNVVTRSTRYGIALFTAIDRRQGWAPIGNRVTGNDVSGSGIADLALADGDGGDNCFEGNRATTVLPGDLQADCSHAGDGDARVSNDLAQPPTQLLYGLPTAPAYSDMDPPPPQPTMPREPGAATPGPSPAPVVAESDAVLLGASVVVVALFVIVIVVVAFRGRVSPSRG